MTVRLRLLATAGVLLVASSLGQAQLTISNPQQLDVPEARARVVWTMTLRVVAEEFQLRDQSKLEFPAVLVLGAKEERYIDDKEHGVCVIYLNDWNEMKFATAALQLVVQRLVAREKGNKMVREIVKRSHQIAPVTAKELYGSEIARRPSPSESGLRGVAASRDTSVRNACCDPAPNRSRR